MSQRTSRAPLLTVSLRAETGSRHDRIRLPAGAEPATASATERPPRSTAYGWPKAIVDPYAFLPSGYGSGIMPNNFGTKLKPNEVTALVNFLSTAAK